MDRATLALSNGIDNDDVDKLVLTLWLFIWLLLRPFFEIFVGSPLTTYIAHSKEEVEYYPNL